MQIELTPDQTKKFETVLWLTDPLGGRATGRTQLLALAYVQHSLSYRTWVHLVNHGFSHPMNDKELIDRVLAVVHNMGGHTVKIRGRQDRTPSILVEPIPPKMEETKYYRGEWKDAEKG